MAWGILLKLLKQFWREGAILLLLGSVGVVWHLYGVRGTELELEKTRNKQLQISIAGLNEDMQNLRSAVEENNQAIDKIGDATKEVSKDIANRMTVFQSDMKDLYDHRSQQLTTDIENRLHGLSPEESCFVLWEWLNERSEQIENGQ